MLPNINTAAGIDMEDIRFLTLSDGSLSNTLEERLKPLENKIALQQRRIKHKNTGTSNIKSIKKFSLLHKRKTGIGNNFLHKISTLHKMSEKGQGLVC